jgi:hypothetical protein
MSLVDREVTPARVAASQANGKKSHGPKTPEGKARSSLNALKTGAYAKTDNALRQIMLKRGENPDEFEQMHQQLIETWHPDDLMQAIVVKSIAEKSFDTAQLRAAWMESQLASLRIAEIQAQRKQLVARRWLPGCPAVEPEAQGLWLAKDSPFKFKMMFDGLDLLEKWLNDSVCPDEYPGLMRELYGECPTLAGERIRLLVIDYFGDDEAAMRKACEELPKWLERERKDVEQERDLYQREMTIKGSVRLNLTEEQVSAKIAAYERQVREQTRFLIQLKTKWPEDGPSDEAPSSEPASSDQPATAPGIPDSAPPSAPLSESAITTERGTFETVGSENRKNDQSNLVSAA